MRATQTGLYEPKPVVHYCAMRPYGWKPEPEEPNLGKNIFPLKIWVSEKMKTGLKQRAALAEVTLGKFLRALICSNLFGVEYDISILSKKALSGDSLKLAESWEQFNE